MLVVGDFGVGKTSLIIRFAEGEFSGRAEMERGTEFVSVLYLITFVFHILVAVYVLPLKRE